QVQEMEARRPRPRSGLDQCAFHSGIVAIHPMLRRLRQVQTDRGEVPQLRRMLGDQLKCLLRNFQRSYGIVVPNRLHQADEVQVALRLYPFRLIPILAMLLKALVKLPDLLRPAIGVLAIVYQGSPGGGNAQEWSTSN